MVRARLLALSAGLFALAGGLSVSPAQDNKGDWGAIKGQIKLSATPEAKKVDVTTDKDHCLSKGPLVYEDLVVNPKTKGVKYVIVWLRPDTENRKDLFPKDKINPALAKAAPKTHVIDQPCCQFVPRVVAAREGDSLEVKNSAPVPHNTNVSADDPALTFNVTLPSGKSHKPEAALKAQNTPIPFKCDIHPWMQGRLFVFDHPYYALTDKDGNFELKNVPAGKWRIVYRHEGGFHKGKDGALGFPIEVKGDKKTMEMEKVEFEMPAQ